MNLVDKRAFTELVLKDKDDRIKRFDDYRKYQSCCRDLIKFGRYRVAESVKLHGYARVLQVFSAYIMARERDFDRDVIILAQQIPMPDVRVRDFINLHPAIVAEEFRKLVKYHLKTD